MVPSFARDAIIRKGQEVFWYNGWFPNDKERPATFGTVLEDKPAHVPFVKVQLQGVRKPHETVAAIALYPVHPVLPPF